MVFDHGAIRTVRWADNGALPGGEAAFTRILRPLGYRLNGTYPLDRIGMTGRSYAHEDAPEEIAQFFVSEFHPERFSEGFQQAVSRVVGASADPLTPRAQSLLWELERDGALPQAEAAELIGVLARCFERQHGAPRPEDYERLLQESAEMAWIATEGNAFNHATDRVEDVFALSEQQKAIGRPMKERSRCRAAAVSSRPPSAPIRCSVPSSAPMAPRCGARCRASFYEFITRDTFVDEAQAVTRTDLGFDAGNAQGIFKMTAAAC